MKKGGLGEHVAQGFVEPPSAGCNRAGFKRSIQLALDPKIVALGGTFGQAAHPQRTLAWESRGECGGLRLFPLPQDFRHPDPGEEHTFAPRASRAASARHSSVPRRIVGIRRQTRSGSLGTGRA